MTYSEYQGIYEKYYEDVRELQNKKEKWEAIFGSELAVKTSPKMRQLKIVKKG